MDRLPRPRFRVSELSRVSVSLTGFRRQLGPHPSARIPPPASLHLQPLTNEKKLLKSGKFSS